MEGRPFGDRLAQNAGEKNRRSVSSRHVLFIIGRVSAGGGETDIINLFEFSIFSSDRALSRKIYRFLHGFFYYHYSRPPDSHNTVVTSVGFWNDRFPRYRYTSKMVFFFFFIFAVRVTLNYYRILVRKRTSGMQRFLTMFSAIRMIRLKRVERDHLSLLPRRYTNRRTDNW